MDAAETDIAHFKRLGLESGTAVTQCGSNVFYHQRGVTERSSVHILVLIHGYPES